MVRKVCLDSDVLISILGGDEQTKQEMNLLDAEFYISEGINRTRICNRGGSDKHHPTTEA